MQKKWYGESMRLGIIGGGQLGRMFIQEAINFDVHVHVLDGDKSAPCSQIAHSFTLGSITDYNAVYHFGADKDIITVEIENVNVEALKQLEAEGKKVYPQPHVLETIKDKGLQKEFYRKNNIPTAAFSILSELNEHTSLPLHYPFVQKLRTGGYDGKGVQVIRQPENLKLAIPGACIVEEMIPFKKELSVIVARNASGETAVYPAVECQFSEEANLVELLFSPAQISDTIEEKARELAVSVIDKLGMVGILAVELFLTEDDELLVNEIAPRPHNSGHHTIECCITSQFEQHLRSILNLPLGATQLIQTGAMVNLLGAKGYSGKAFYAGMETLLKLPGVHVHLYGKEETKPFRKMGHITVAGPDLSSVIEQASFILKTVEVRSV